MATVGTCPDDEDSPLSITSSTVAIMTFVFAVSVWIWIRWKSMNKSEKEFEEFEAYLRRHKVELIWMKSLLVHGEERPVLNHERTNPNQLVFDNNRLSAEIPPLENQNLSSKDRAHKRWRRATRYAIRIFHVQQAATDDLEERLRHVRMGQKRKLRERQEEREKRVFSDILKHLTDLDKKLQQIVDSVRPPKEEKRKDITKLQPNAETGSIAIELRRMPRLAEENGRLPVAHTIESERQRSLSDRAAEKIKALGPTSWKTKYKIAYKWMRQRDRATELKHERDILWNRVHASQLSLLGRRIDDQNEILDQLELHIGQQGRAIHRIARVANHGYHTRR